MFTGLVERTGKLESLEAAPPGAKLIIASPEIARDSSIGDSVAINGCCLTVVERNEGTFAFDAGPETLRRTNLGALKPGDDVNLERSLKVGDPLGGHFVTGHIDAVGRVSRRVDEEEWSTFWFETTPELLRQMASKGSVAVDGVSLTLVDVDARSFSVALIPHTLKITTLGQRQVGDVVNLESDILAKYVEKQLAR